MERTIWDLRAAPWSDAPRFYRPGKHPATLAMRAQLRTAEELRQRVLDLHRGTEPITYLLPAFTRLPDTRPAPDTTQIDEFIAYCKDELAKFESRESELKAAEHSRLVAGF